MCDVVWRGEGVVEWEGRSAKERAVGEKGREIEVGVCVGDMDRAREVFWGRGVGGRGESGSWDVWWRSHAGTGTGARSLAPPAATAHTCGVVELGVEAERFVGVGRAEKRSRLKQSLGCGEGGPRKATSWGQDRNGKDVCGVGTREGEGGRELWSCVWAERSEEGVVERSWEEVGVWSLE